MDNPINLIPASLDAQRLQAAAPSHDKNKVSQDQFLKLMIAQLKNQDPMKPMDNGQFLTQMAQIGTVSGINDLQKSFGTLASALQSTQALQASTMVGRNVLVASDHVVLAAGEQPKLGLELASAANQVRVSISDAAGQLVKQFDLGARPAGISEFSWDGSNAGGGSALAGRYVVRAEALIDGKGLAATTLVRAPVQSVTLPPNGGAALLNLANFGAFGLDTIKRVL